MDPDTSLGPRIKLANFDFASMTKPEEGGVGLTVSLGTRMSMAPELVSGESKPHTRAVDIWAVGVLAFYLLSYGSYPFSGT